MKGPHRMKSPTLTESPDGTTVTTAGPVIVASSTPGVAGAQNSISISPSGTILVNGHSPGGIGVIELYKTNHSVYQFNGTDWYGPITAKSTGPSPIPTPVVGSNPPPGTIHYGTTPPATLPITTGSVSPLGWTVGFFDDFTSWTQSTTSDLAATDATKNWYCLVDDSKFILNPGLEQEFYCNPYRTPGCNPFSHSGSVLTITASAPTPAQLATIKACKGYQASNYTQHGGPFISGAFNSGQVYESQYGYFEINCTQPNGPGCWTAFWFPDPGDTHKPHEIDMMEQVLNNNIGTGVLTLPGGDCYSSTTHVNADTTFDTYGCLWCPNYTAFYFNGALVHTCPAAGAGTVQMIIDFAIGGGNGAGYAKATDLPKSWNIDWIRCSKLGPA